MTKDQQPKSLTCSTAISAFDLLSNRRIADMMCLRIVEGTHRQTMVSRITYYPPLMHHALRAALVLVCMSVAMGNGLAVLLLNLHTTLASQTVLTEEMPVEEAPVETEFPAELIELNEFTAHSGSFTHRRRTIATLRGAPYVEPHRWIHDFRMNHCAVGSVMLRRNGCGAALRC